MCNSKSDARKILIMEGNAERRSVVDAMMRMCGQGKEHSGEGGEKGAKECSE